MGALETLYRLVYGKSPDSTDESDILGAPDRLKMYALTKLMEGKQGLDDYSDWINDQDIKSRAREAPAYDEKYLDPKAQDAINYWRKEYLKSGGKLRPVIENPLDSPLIPRGAKSSQSDVPTAATTSQVAVAEKVGETADERGTSPYVDTTVPRPFRQGEWDSAISHIMTGADQLTADEEANRRANSVRIDIPGGYQGMQRIVQQAGGTPGGGTFSIGGGVTGGDTTEDLRRYVNDYRFSEVDRQIALIEQAFPATNRPPALDARLNSLYEARANRDQQETLRQRLPIEAAQAEADLIQAGGMNEYYRNTPEAQKYAADRSVDIARIQAGQKSDKEFNTTAQKIVDSLNKEAARSNEPKARAAAVYIGKIINRTDLNNMEKDRMIQEALAAIGYDNVAALTGTNLATPTGEDELDLLMYGTGTK